MTDIIIPLKIESSPVKRKSKPIFNGIPRENKKVSIIGSQRSKSFSHPLNNFKANPNKNTSNKLSKTPSDDNLNVINEEEKLISILRNKDMSPRKVLKRLKTQGTLKKPKLVSFKSNLVEVKEVKTLSYYRHEQANSEKVQIACSNCTCQIF